jgi:hypothetical protein
MKFTVIGHFSIDVRHSADGAEHRAYAGILNAVRALAVLAPGDTVYPVFGVGERDYYGVKTALASYANVDISGVYSQHGDSNEVHYFPGEGGAVVACAKKISSPIPWAKIEPFMNTGGVLINMISGADITVDTLDEIRMAVRAKSTPVHIDLHNLTLGVNADATRFRRPLSDWRRWCFMINSVQMNAEEAAGLTLEYTDIDHLVKQMVPLMVQAFVVTHGAKGAVVYEAQHKSTIAHPIDGIPAAKAADTVGCGDIFGAAFLARACASKNYADAGMFANRAAALSAQFEGDERYSVLAQMKDT